MYVCSIQLAEILKDAQFLYGIGAKLSYKSNMLRRAEDSQVSTIQVYKRNTIQRGVAHSRLQASKYKTVLQNSKGILFHANISTLWPLSQLVRSWKCSCNFPRLTYTTFCTYHLFWNCNNQIKKSIPFLWFARFTYQFSFSMNLISSLYSQH